MQTHLELPFFFLHHGSHYVQRGVGKAEHQQQGKLVLYCQDEDVVYKSRVRKP